MGPRLMLLAMDDTGGSAAALSVASRRVRRVAGGMAKKGAPLPAWLVAANAETRAAAEESMRLRRPERNPFVWVLGSDADYPGIVVDRRRVGAGWQILVAYVSPRWEMVVQWLDAEQLQPADLPGEAYADG